MKFGKKSLVERIDIEARKLIKSLAKEKKKSKFEFLDHKRVERNWICCIYI